VRVSDIFKTFKTQLELNRLVQRIHIFSAVTKIFIRWLKFLTINDGCKIGALLAI